MSKNKLAKFADMAAYPHVFEYPYSKIKDADPDIRGRWRDFFGNDNPIVVELGCGRGEYTVGLAGMFPRCNFIGVDIKGARMWSGATESLAKGLGNVAFVRTNIEMIDRFFEPGEVSGIWLTFPDPQMKKCTKRLTSTFFMERYRRFLKDNGTISLKTDSNFLFTYTHYMVEHNRLPLLAETDDLYHSGLDDEILSIKTYYEQQWLERGLTIKYMKFMLPHEAELSEPDVEIENKYTFIMSIYPKLILDALSTVRYPGTGKNIVEADMVEDDIRIEGSKVSFSLIFDKPTDPFIKSIVKAAETAIETYVGQDVEIRGNIAVKSRKAARPEVGKLLPGVKNIIAVSSGKGGVGKSTVAANLAVALANMGYKTGLLDADIFGPSIPKMFNVEDARPYAEEVDGRDMIVPIEKYGLKLLSIGFFVDPDQATLWRGGMASNALRQLIGDSLWGDLDFFVLDLPPGTSDIHLTIVQTLAVTGVVVVSTPQEVALADARKGINMFVNDKINVPILGLVENMSWFTPEELPDNKYYIFGKEGVKRLAEEMHVPLLGQIPIVGSICESGDEGTPVALDKDSITGRAFMALAERVVEETDRRNKEKAPTHIVEVHKK